jgi:hypothetical protein
MNTRSAGWLAVLLVLAAASAATAATAPPAANSEAPLTTDQLIYENTSIEVQVDVNGEAAMQLLGGLIDAVAEVAQQQGAAMAQAGPVPPEVAKMAQPLIEPAKEAIKSVSRVSVLVMRPSEPVNIEQAMTYYHGLMTSRGWTPMVTVRAKDEARILVLLAPGAKGVFAAVLPTGDEMVVAMIATTKPLGDLLAEVVRAAGGPALQGMLAMRAGAAAHPQSAPPAPEPEPAPEE